MVNVKSALIAALGAVAVGFAASAGAQSSEPAPKLVVRYDAATLDTDSGVRKLYGRLVTAAEKVCEEPGVGKFTSEAVLACRKQAVTDAVAQIHNTRLVELSADYFAKIG